MRGRKVDVVIAAPGERVRDAEGRWTATGEESVVRAHVAAAANAVGRQGTDRERPGRGDRGDGVVLLPGGFPLDTSHIVHVYGAKVIPDGPYRIRVFTRTRKHVRVAIERVAAN